MAPFSFGAGNARKLVRLPLYLLGRLATWLIPRRPGLWVFGSAVGLADGGWALWRVAADAGRPAVWLVSNTRQERDAAVRGIRHVRVHSLRGFWLTARASIVVITHGFGDVNRYASAGAFVVQLWHGIPLKRIGLDSPATTRIPLLGDAAPVRRLLAFAFARTTRRIALIPAASHLVRGRLQSAFGLPDAAVPVTGEPRVDVLSQGAERRRRERARADICAAVGAVPSDTPIVLYAPTWRDGADDPAVPDGRQWREIDAMLERTGAVLLVRSHPLGAGSYRPPEPTLRIRALPADDVADVTPLLPGVDLLLTDYSSLAYDAALVPLPTLYLAPDLESYRAARGLYGTYEDVTGGAHVCDWDELVRNVENTLGDEAEQTRLRARAQGLSGTVHAYADGENTSRVYRAILARAGARAATGGTT